MRRAVVGSHLLLIGALVAGVVPPVTMLRLAVAALLATPLLLTLSGLLAARRVTLQRLAVLLVAYIGGLCVEVVARSGDAPALAVALLVAVLELGLLLALTRRSLPNGPENRE
jgi:ABC-type multidrug transport system permease subunit